VGKETGETAHIERWNNTLRQQLARFLRKTLSFSKCIKIHEIFLKLFIHRYLARYHFKNHHYPAIIPPGQQIDLFDIVDLQRLNGPKISDADLLKGHKGLFYCIGLTQHLG